MASTDRANAPASPRSLGPIGGIAIAVVASLLIWAPVIAWLA